MWRLALPVVLGLALAACTTAPTSDGSLGDGSSGAVAPAPTDAPFFTILWAGDTLLADAAQPLLHEHGYDWPFQEVAPALEADYTIVNLEGPLTTDNVPWDPDQRWSYNAQPDAAAALAAIGVDAAGLANNHALDRGPDGIAATVGALTAAGIQPFGAGFDADAKAPLLIDTPYGVVGVVAFGPDKGFGRTASATRTGTLAPTPTGVVRGLALARQAGARWVIGFVHWGSNYAGVEPQQRRWAQRFADAGYDLVIGHGPHLAQPVEFVDGMPVFYSLGNFVFGTPGRYTPDAPGISLLLTTVIGPDGIRAAEIRCLLTDNDEVAFQPRLCLSEHARSVLRGLHPNIELEEDVATLRW